MKGKNIKKSCLLISGYGLWDAALIATSLLSSRHGDEVAFPRHSHHGYSSQIAPANLAENVFPPRPLQMKL